MGDREPILFLIFLFLKEVCRKNLMKVNDYRISSNTIFVFKHKIRRQEIIN